jgi:hypothetical protein
MIDGPNFPNHQQDFLDEDFGFDDLEVMLNDNTQKPKEPDFFSELKQMEQKNAEHQ